MKRNKFGINIDEGIPLIKPEEISKLYIEDDHNCEKELSNWLTQEDSKALMFGGQIGTGKTTIINAAFNKSTIYPDITFHFDRSSLDISILDCWVVAFAALARFSIKHNFDFIDKTFPSFRLVLGNSIPEWEISIGEILLETISIHSIEKNNAFRRALEPMLGQLPQLFTATITDLEKQKHRKILLFASGVDKFMPIQPAYFGLRDVLETLVCHRTIVEANAVHLFENDPWTKNISKIFLRPADQEWICKLLNNRLGKYAEAYKNVIADLAGFSGGIPRQALRILDAYMAAKKKNSDPRQTAITSANRDFFAYSKAPKKELLIAVKRDAFLETSLITLPGDTEDALKAVFGNWVILYKQLSESRWSTQINPLIKMQTAVTTPEPVQTILSQYANQYGTSGYGLNINTSDSSSFEHLSSLVEKPLSLNIIEVLDQISSALLSKERADRIIVGFESKEVLDAVMAYFEAKSNSYEFQLWKHDIIIADGISLVKQLVNIFKDSTSDIYSIEMDGDFTKEELEQLNMFRDNLIDKQLIFWVQKKYLQTYLMHWTQLRQLFEVFILEENLSKVLSSKEIQADIDFMSELKENNSQASTSYVLNLKRVLAYLKEAK